MMTAGYNKNTKNLLLKCLLQLLLAVLLSLFVVNIRMAQSQTFASKEHDYYLWQPPRTPPSMTIPLASNVLCALFCQQKACHTFSFEDGECVLGGIGESNNSSQHFYKNLNTPGPFQLAEMPRFLPTTSSEPYGSRYASSKAVDEDLGSWFCSKFGVVHHWWRIDLGSLFYIHIIDLFPRNAYDDAQDFREIEIRVGETDISSGDFTSWPLFAYYAGPYTPTAGRLQFTSDEGVVGRYISVQRNVDVTDGALKLFDAKFFVRMQKV